VSTVTDPPMPRTPRSLAVPEPVSEVAPAAPAQPVTAIKPAAIRVLSCMPLLLLPRFHVRAMVAHGQDARQAPRSIEACISGPVGTFRDSAVEGLELTVSALDSVAGSRR